MLDYGCRPQDIWRVWPPWIPIREEHLFERNRKKKSTMFTSAGRQYLQNGNSCLIPFKYVTPCPTVKNVQFTLQNAFPGKKLALSKDVATTVKTVINANDETHATREILANLQPLFESRYGHSFTDAVTRLPGSQLQAKPNSVEEQNERFRESRLTTNELMLSLCLQKHHPCKATSDCDYHNLLRV